MAINNDPYMQKLKERAGLMGAKKRPKKALATKTLISPVEKINNRVFNSDIISIAVNAYKYQLDNLERDKKQMFFSAKEGGLKCPLSGLPIDGNRGGHCFVITGIKNENLVTQPTAPSIKNLAYKVELCSPHIADVLPQLIINAGLETLYVIPEVLMHLSDMGILHEYTTIGRFSTLDIPVDIVKYNDYYKFNNKINKSNGLEKHFLHTYGLESATFKSTLGFKYTFGVEIECSQSFVPHFAISQFNMSCVRDGSLNGGKGGPEYVTGVLQGDSGMMHLQKILNFLSPRSLIDKYCGVHIHVGGFSPSKEFSLSIFLISYLVQNELFLTIPKSRRTNEYCRIIPNKPVNDIYRIFNIKDTNLSYKNRIDQAYDLLVEYVAALHLLGGKEQFMQSKGTTSIGKFLNKNSTHPLGKKANYNHSSPRYEWLNLVPLLFNEKGSDVFTVEFRPHQASLNFSKIKNWSLICFCLVNYAETNSKALLEKNFNTNLSLEEVITTVLSSKLSSKFLLNYIEERKDKFLKQNSEKNTAIIEQEEYHSESFVEPEDKKLKEICV